MKLVNLDRPFWHLSARDINWVMFHLDVMSGDDCSRSVANLIGFELEEEAWERNDL